MNCNLLHIFLIFSLFFGSGFAQNFYDVDEINTLEIYFKESNWDSILHEYKYDAEGERLICSVNINGERFDSVGIRYKGFSSYDPDYEKKPLNIQLDYIKSNQSYQGIETLKLSNGWRDPSHIREVLSYEIARSYMPASQGNFMNVYINDEYYGIYSSAETIDKNFLEKHFFENEGVFIKGDPEMVRGGFGFKGSADLRYVGDDEIKYYSSYDLKSDSGWIDLIKFCDILNNRVEDIETIFNVDRALWLLAFHNLLVSLDSPVAAPRNFYLYKDINGIFQIIPWDLNMAFGTYSLIDGTWDHTAEEIQQLDPLYHKDSEDFHLVRQMLQIDRYQKMYLAHMHTILNEKFLSGWYEDRAHHLQNMIDEAIRLDDKSYFTYNDFQTNLDFSVYDDRRLLVGITELMEGRAEFLENHPLFQSRQPEISNFHFNFDRLKTDSTLHITAKINDAEIAQFAYRASIKSPFKKIHLYDDGKHGESGPQDGVYGAYIKPASNKIQYYIYAENSNAAKFSPEGAEYKLHEIQFQYDLVINEFLAKNDTTKADQNGEYDDWVELYNNTDLEISLKNYHLSDNAEDIFKWEFPDTSIDPFGYLIVWADEDGNQKGLHANFKLSGNGEVIFLVNSDSMIIDEVVFGNQRKDLSMGRFPNGIGGFTTLVPSFGSDNLYEYEIDDEEPEIPEDFCLSQNYPNPFNPKTMINYQLSTNSDVELSIFNVLGQKITTLVNEYQAAGDYFVEWDANTFAAGVYFYRLQAGSYQEIKKAILIK